MVVLKERIFLVGPLNPLNGLLLNGRVLKVSRVRNRDSGGKPELYILRTPAENLNCIYCGEVLPRPVGMMSGLRYSLRGWLAALIAMAVLISFLVLIL
jgi:hypothetical protein